MRGGQAGSGAGGQQTPESVPPPCPTARRPACLPNEVLT